MIERLANLNGICGFEDEVRDCISNELKEYPQKFDSIGNLHVYNKKTNDILIAAHMDEVGFIITDITDDGYLKFSTIGKIDAAAVLSKRVKIGSIYGVISFKAIHLTGKEEREKPIDISKLFIDIGAKSKKDAEKYVTIGDLCTFDINFGRLGSDYIFGKALNGRAGCAILTEVLKDKTFSCDDVYGLFTVQHEILSRGMKVAAQNIAPPKFGVIIDYIDVNTAKEIVLGNGAVLGIPDNASITERTIYNRISKAAKRFNLKVQVTTCPYAREADALKSVNADFSVIQILVPCRNANTDVCILNENDIKSAHRVIEILLSSSKGKEI